MEAVHSFSAWSITPIFNILSISVLSNSSAFGPDLYSAQSIGQTLSDANSIWGSSQCLIELNSAQCSSTLVRPKWQSYLDSNSVNNPKNLSPYASNLVSDLTFCLQSCAFRLVFPCSALMWRLICVFRFSTFLYCTVLTFAVGFSSFLRSDCTVHFVDAVLKAIQICLWVKRASLKG